MCVILVYAALLSTRVLRYAYDQERAMNVSENGNVHESNLLVALGLADDAPHVLGHQLARAHPKVIFPGPVFILCTPDLCSEHEGR